jgi:imidazolonepropionase-like amidohydrolase
MKRPPLLLPLLAAPIALFGQTPAVVLKADRILDGKGGTIAGSSWIVVENGRIARIASSGEGLRADWDLSGLTVLPGLIDAHDHVGWHFNRKGRTHTDDDGETAGESALAGAANAWATLQAGFTTVQSPGSDSDKELRDAIGSGAVPGPRVLTSLEPMNEKSGSPAELRELVRQRAAAGADLIKLFASKSIRDGGAQTMTQEQLDAACGEARSLGLRTLVHAHSAEAMKLAAQAGCNQIEHGIFATPEVLQLMVQKGMYFSPQCGLVFRNYLGHRANYEGIGNYNAQGFASMEKALPMGVEVIKKAMTTPGLKLVFGTDAVAGAHGHNVDDLICRVQEAGQKPMDALLSATSVAAQSMGLADSLGTLAPGKAADVIAVAGNPMTDFTMMRNVVFVMKGGHVVKHIEGTSPRGGKQGGDAK